MKVKRSLIRVLLGLLIIFLLGSCDIIFGVKKDTRVLLQNAIDELGAQPGRWQTTLNSTIDELGKVGGQLAKDIRYEVQSLYNQSVMTTQEAAFCGADFIGIRVKQRMQEILHRFYPDTPPPTHIPVICLIDPPIIQSDSTTQVKYSGFDFNAFQDGTFSADLIYGDNGELIRQGFGTVNVGTNYYFVIDIQGFDFTNIQSNRHPKMVLLWEGQTPQGVKSDITVNIVPLQAQQEPTPEPLGSCKPTMWFSEETGSVFCPEGYALRGLDCSGSYCDDKSMFCCPYMNSADPNVQTYWTGWFSEEQPNNFAISADSFVAGMKCDHDYCDILTLFMITTPNLINAGQCYYSQHVSEETGRAECADGEFAAGMACYGSYCDNVSLYCCKANRP